MDFALMVSAQHGLTYEQQLAAARLAESRGFEAFLRSDHYLGAPGPIDRSATDAWMVIAGLAREVPRIRLGVLVSPVTFRLPGTLAKIIATAAEMSGDRIDVGLGAGWNAEEHTRMGIPYPDLKVRAEMLEEQLEVLRGLWSGPDGWSFSGRHYQVREAVFRPKPQPGIRVIVGGEGTARSLRIAARWADEFNLTNAVPEKAATVFGSLKQTLERLGREPASVRCSVLVPVFLGRSEANVASRLELIADRLGIPIVDRKDWVDGRHREWITGSPADAVETLDAFRRAGATRLIAHLYLPEDQELVGLIADASSRLKAS